MLISECRLPASGFGVSGRGGVPGSHRSRSEAQAKGNGGAVDFRGAVARCDDDARGTVAATSGHSFRRPPAPSTTDNTDATSAAEPAPSRRPTPWRRGCAHRLVDRGCGARGVRAVRREAASAAPCRSTGSPAGSGGRRERGSARSWPSVTESRSTAPMPRLTLAMSEEQRHGRPDRRHPPR